MKNEKKANKKSFGFNKRRIISVMKATISGVAAVVFLRMFKEKMDLWSVITIIFSIIEILIERILTNRKEIQELLRIMTGKKKSRRKIKKENPHNIYKIDIIEKFSKAQFQKNTIALISVTFCLVICLCLRTFLIIEINRMVPVILIILAWLILIHQFLLAYRVKKQYYGTNYEEAKELLRFVNQSKDDAPHSGKYVFNDEMQSAPATDKLVEYES